LIHLLALSGLQVSWLASLARVAGASMGGGPVARALAGAACALAYLGIAGPLPSMARAAVTECLVAAGRIGQRALDPVQCLAVTVILLLACFPGWAGDLGFQLSCAATLGLVTVGARVTRAWPRWRRVVAPFAATAGAQVVALPLLVASFHSVAWTVLLTNLVAGPIVGVLLAAAWLGILAELAFPGSGAVAWNACELLSRALVWVLDVGSMAPRVLLPTGQAGAAAVCGGLGAALLAMWGAARDVPPGREPSAARAGAAVIGSTLVAAATVGGLAPTPLLPPAGRVWIVTLDVGQGLAVAVASSEGWWLIDAGPRTPRFDAGDGVVTPFFHWAGVPVLDGLVVTHPDADHAGGAASVARALAPGTAAGSGCFEPAVARRDWRRLWRGDTLLAGPPTLRVLWPPRGLRPSATNQGSVVLELDGAGRALLLADVDSLVESMLDVRAPVDLVVVGHHGAGSSSGSRFLARASPRAAVVSCGAQNPFGHPHPSTLARLARARAVTWRTDLEGAVWVELSNDGVRRIDWRRWSPPADPSERPRVPRILARPIPRC
jgi:competence protein ComEC